MHFPFRILLFFCCSNSLAQQIPDIGVKQHDTLITYSWYNHASFLFDGVRHVAVTTDSIFAWTSKWHNWTLKEATITDERKTARHIDSVFIGRLRALNLDTLNDLYVEESVMLTSGNEYSITVQFGTTRKKIWLHSYFLQGIRNLVDLLNEQLPQGYSAEYLLGPISEFWDRK